MIEWAVHLKRFDENRTFDLVAERGEMTSAMIAQIADLILDSHRKATVGEADRATAALEAVVDETLKEIIETPKIFPAQRAADYAEALRSAFNSVRALLLERGSHGSIRRCHGDLHMRNIALFDNGPVLFDAIEFDESIATTDVYYDLAFALMDLWNYSLFDKANLLLNRYLWRCDDLTAGLAGLAALPLFLSLRAAVLAKIDALRFVDSDKSVAIKLEALRYFDLATEFLLPARPVLVAFGGLSGSGKSVVAGKIAALIGRAPGAIHLRSDIERKRQLVVPETQRLPQSAYRREMTDSVYAALRDQAGIALRAGQSVIVDAVHRDPEQRRQIEMVAGQAGAHFIGLWLDAPVELLIDRVEHRIDDASDATGAVILQQAQTDTGLVEWLRLDASLSLATVVNSA
ncbi:MAG: AAA family ATPase, partial [Alphaproteobacteria bacterium]